MRIIQIRSALNLYIGVNETESILLSPMRFVGFSTSWKSKWNDRML